VPVTRLALLDQAAFLRLRATGQGSVVQSTWVYDRDVDIDALRTFNEHLATGLLGRRIERSPLPFGRHRWVAGARVPGIDIVAASRPRDEIGTWVEQRARITVDPERGPTFHLGAQPLDDGGTVISLVASHCVVDGLGLVTAIAEAVKGESREFGYPQPHSRGRWRAASEDFIDALRAMPAVIRALIATLLILLRLSPTAKAPSTPPYCHQDDAADQAGLGSVTIQTDAAAWDARARELGGSSNALCIAFAARLADRMGRVQPDGSSVTVVLPVSERTADDGRANALSSITISVDSKAVLDDLIDVRADVKSRLTSLAEQPNELLAGLPLVPFTPRWLVRHTEGIAMATGQLPVGCSNLGNFDSVIRRIDGGNATEVSMRLAEQGITRERIERARGQLFCGTGAVNGSRFITVVAYRCGAENTAASTRELAGGALADLQLSATTVR